MTQPLNLNLPDGLRDRLDEAARIAGSNRWAYAQQLIEQGVSWLPQVWTVDNLVATEWLPADTIAPPQVWQQPQWTERGVKVAERSCSNIMAKHIGFHCQYWGPSGQLVVNSRFIEGEK